MTNKISLLLILDEELTLENDMDKKINIRFDISRYLSESISFFSKYIRGLKNLFNLARTTPSPVSVIISQHVFNISLKI